jgi:hypothetical protein
MIWLERIFGGMILSGLALSINFYPNNNYGKEILISSSRVDDRFYPNNAD